MSARRELLAWIGQGIGKPPGWERVVRWLASPESCKSLPDMLVVRDGSSFLVQPSTVPGWNVLFCGPYEPELRTLLSTGRPGGAVPPSCASNHASATAAGSSPSSSQNVSHCAICGRIAS